MKKEHVLPKQSRSAEAVEKLFNPSDNTIRSPSDASAIMPQTVLQQSHFTHVFRKNGSVCIFHALTRRMLFGDKRLAELYDQFTTPSSARDVIAKISVPSGSAELIELIGALEERGLLVRSAEADIGTYQRCFAKGMGQYRVHHMYLLPTSGCNFQCKYCFVEDARREQEPGHMSLKTAELAIRLFAKLASGNGRASVTIYGGEPLVNPRTTFFALRLLRQLADGTAFPQGIEISMLSNGSLIDEETIRVLRETRTRISISIDGPGYLHDSARKDQSNSGTFERALHGYRRLQDAGLRPSISCTLNAYTLDHVDEIVDFIINDMHPSGMGFNLLLPRSDGLDFCTLFDHEFASHELIRAFKRLRSVGIYEDRMMRRIRPFIENRIYYKDCMGVGGQIVVTPSGRIGPCQAFLGVDDKKYFPLDLQELVALGDLLSGKSI